MKRLFLISILALILSACGPSQEAIQSTVQASISQTQAAVPTETPVPTDTPAPTGTPKPTPTNRPVATNTRAPTVNEVRQKLLDAVISDLSSQYEDVGSVSVVRFKDGTLEIELKTVWASRDRQADVSWTIIQAFSNSFHDFDKKNLDTVAGGPFAISLTTYSTDGDYRYKSFTDWDTIQELARKSISYEEWTAVSGAGFK